jgi:ribose-phosphate pyrophosphokinase
MFTALVLSEYSAGFDVAKLLGLEIVAIHEKEFPDEELYVRILEPDRVKSRNIIVFSTLYPKQERALLKTLLAVDAAKRAGALEVTAVIPYLAYARQDKLFLPGEPVSASLIIELLKNTGVSRLVTVDVHSLHVLESLPGKALNVMVSDLLVEHALKYLVDPLIIAPDKGAYERACYAARTHGLKCDYLIKQRDRITGEVSYTPREISVSNRDVVLVDDIISTGGTVAEATKILITQGARRVIVAATHGLLVGGAMKKLEEAGVYRVLLANTLNIKHAHPLIEYIDISTRLASELKKFLGI